MRHFKKKDGLTSLEFSIIALIIVMVIFLFLSNTVKLIEKASMRTDLENAHILMTAIRYQHLSENEPMLAGVDSYDTYNAGEDYTINLIENPKFLKSLDYFEKHIRPVTGSTSQGYWIKYNKATNKYFVHWVDNDDENIALGSVESSANIWKGVNGEILFEVKK